jgi:alcohol dehydrogenase (cytochrome c)
MRKIWLLTAVLEEGVQRSAITRGAATIYNGKLFRVTIDNHIVALNMKTGKQLWNQKYAESKEGYYSTSAPIVANGVVISGMAGGESTTRGFLDGWDPETGKKLWRRYTIPAPGEPGSETWPENTDAWTRGGAPTWRSGSYDPSSTWCIGAPAMRSHGILLRAAVWIVCTHRACSPSGRKPASSSASTNIRRMTCTT